MLVAGLVHASGVDLSKFRRIEPWYIAALGDLGATSGNGAQSWGFWSQDPGPRGCKLDRYDQLKAADGVAPAQWKFDAEDWWLEEHGLIMEKKIVDIGVIAHISAVSPAGPRYDPSKANAERQWIDNAIWLCATCTKLIDYDAHKYSAEILRGWKAHAEQVATAAHSSKMELGRRTSSLNVAR